MRHPPPRPDGRLETIVTSLEMLVPPTAPAILPPDDGVVIEQAIDPTVSFYRSLYDAVGEDNLWGDRRKLDDAALKAIVQHPLVAIYVLRVHGVPAGYAELDSRIAGEIELAYFGLIPEFIGRGLGTPLLDFAIRAAWARGPRRLWVHTCTLDHPRALATYERAGFRVIGRRTEVGDDPRSLGLIRYSEPG